MNVCLKSFLGNAENIEVLLLLNLSVLYIVHCIWLGYLSEDGNHTSISVLYLYQKMNSLIQLYEKTKGVGAEFPWNKQYLAMRLDCILPSESHISYARLLGNFLKWSGWSMYDLECQAGWIFDNKQGSCVPLE